MEKRYLGEVIDSDVPFFYMGTKVRALEQRFAEMYGMKHCIAAQAYCCRYKDRLAGTMGRTNAFSLNHFNHITCGSGGMILTNDDALRYQASIFLDECYRRDEGIRDPFFLAPNYQMTELQGAVALAQLEKVEQIVAARNRLGMMLDGYLREIPGVTPQATPTGCRHGYFLYLFPLDLEALRCTSQAFADALAAEGIPNRARLITGGMPVYQYRIFRDRSALPGTEWPLQGRTYGPGDCPVAEAAFDRWITMNIYEHYTETDIAETAHAVARVAHHLRTRASRG